MSSEVVVVGAGLAGSLVALFLGRRGFDVKVVEKRQDWRIQEDSGEIDTLHGQLSDSSKRSINLAISYRGLCALDAVGLKEDVMKIAIPMRARVVHGRDGSIDVQPYGIGDQAIYSVSRGALNKMLLVEAEKLKTVEFLFGYKCSKIDRKGQIKFEGDSKEFELYPRVVIGADGAFSAVRQSLGSLTRLNMNQQFIPDGYKELTIPPNKDGDYALPHHDGLHIWPRGRFMLIALPNPDKSFTCTLFAPHEGENGIDSLLTPDDVRRYFLKFFPDAVPVMPSLVEDFFANPTSSLVTLQVSPWHYKDKVTIIGDAAHAVVPFYGQGANAAFEDCLIFDELMERFGNDFSRVLPAFTAERQPACVALAELSLQNYIEMRHKTAQTSYVIRKKFDTFLHKLAPSYWSPLYTMVAFTRTPYHKAIEQAQRQDRIVGHLRTFGLLSLLAAGAAVGVKYYAKWRQQAQQ
eukprot:GILJ01005651.1.p1 GENE.GILJ01005651.1~~GILJ01005651.1.p1  ORF type:complete len:463 (-),score=69.93 GILJ01005651.1:13-1401(-)